ncbi:MAG: hypothetical protein H0U92_10275 [Actinobacteria bacterium]|nr:hypothetical protein [Actinomycetota bacterium]
MQILLPPFLRRDSRRDERGAVLIIGAVACLMAISFAALGVDIGRIAVDKKNDQNVADLAALDAARALGFVVNTTNQAGYDGAANTAADASAARNHFVENGSTFTVDSLTGSLNSSNNFVPDASASAVQVTVKSRVKNQFVSGSKDLTATAVALVGGPIAAFSVGSTLTSLDTSRSYLDPVLKNWLGATGSLSAVSYNGLATGNVSLGKLQTALLAAGVSVGTVDQLLTTDITVKKLLQATASALGTSTATTEINDLIAANINQTATIKLNQLVNVATPSDSAVLSGTVNVYHLVNGAAELMNGSSFATVANNVTIGAATLDASVKLISPAQTGIGPIGTTAENAQGVVKATLHVKAGLLNDAVDVALTYTVGQAKGTLSSIVCGASPSIGVSVATAGSSVSATGTTAVTGTLTLTPTSVAASGPTALSFGYPAEFTPVSKRAPNATSGLGSTTIATTGTGNVLLNLILAVTNPLTNVIATAVTNATSTLTPILKAIGLDVGAADVTALGIFPDPTSCGGHPRLVK